MLRAPSSPFCSTLFFAIVHSGFPYSPLRKRQSRMDIPLKPMRRKPSRCALGPTLQLPVEVSCTLRNIISAVPVSLPSAGHHLNAAFVSGPSQRTWRRSLTGTLDNKQVPSVPSRLVAPRATGKLFHVGRAWFSNRKVIIVCSEGDARRTSASAVGHLCNEPVRGFGHPGSDYSAPGLHIGWVINVNIKAPSQAVSLRSGALCG